MTTQHNLTDEEQNLLANFSDLTEDDRKVTLAFIHHILELSLAKRNYHAVLRQFNIIDHAAERPRA